MFVVVRCMIVLMLMVIVLVIMPMCAAGAVLMLTSSVSDRNQDLFARFGVMVVYLTFAWLTEVHFVADFNRALVIFGLWLITRFTEPFFL